MRRSDTRRSTRWLTFCASHFPDFLTFFHPLAIPEAKQNSPARQGDLTKKQDGEGAIWGTILILFSQKNSTLNTSDGRNSCPRFYPLIVGFERQAEHLVIHPQISVRSTSDRVWHDLLHFLRHNANIKVIAALVTEAIEAEAVVEITEERDVVFEPGV